MRILFDHGTPAPLAAFLAGHSVTKAKDQGWDTLSNGDLLTVAEEAGFDLLLTTDKNIRYQQNLEGRGIAIVVLGVAQWPVVKKHVSKVVQAVTVATPGSYIEVDIPSITMEAHVQAYSKSPAECSAAEVQDFEALVLAGGEVTAAGLGKRIHSAYKLTFLVVHNCLCGVAALKRPLETHRRKVSNNSGVPLAGQEFPYELGWVFLTPSARGKGLSLGLTGEALSNAGNSGIFATSRADNTPMHKTLEKVGFSVRGKTWQSGRGKHQVKLFVRPAS